MTDNGRVLSLDAETPEQRWAREHPVAVGNLNAPVGNPNAPTPSERHVAHVLRIAMHALAERAYPWVTLGCAVVMWGFVAWGVTVWQRPALGPILTATIFTILTHVPTWSAWRRQ